MALSGQYASKLRIRTGRVSEKLKNVLIRKRLVWVLGILNYKVVFSVTEMPPYMWNFITWDIVVIDKQMLGTYMYA